MKLHSAFLVLSVARSSYAVVKSIRDDENETCSANNLNGTTCKPKVDPYKPKYKDTCRFYLAQSSIPNAGFGIYTVDDIPGNIPVTEVADAPSIIVTDLEYHNDGKRTNWNHHNYFWDGSGQGEFESQIVEEGVLTFGSLCNFHTYLKNVKPYGPVYDDTITPRSSGSPGMGAYSYHPGYHFHSTRDIMAGEEIFCDYGEEWLDGRNFGEAVTRAAEFETAGKLIKKTIEGLAKGGDISDPVLSVVKDVVGQFDERVANILPGKSEEINVFKENILNPNDIARHLADKSVLQRSIDWIKTEGKCIDNLVPQISTLPDAGRGAFAQRFIAKGETVVPAPLLQIMDYNTLIIWDYTLDKERNPQFSEDSSKRGDQLIMNYCMSHPETSMYMCPQTNGVLLNHCSTRKSYGGDCERYNENKDPNLRGANAEMRWATNFDPDTEDWLKLTVQDIDKKVTNGKRGLSMDIVATRDIYPGDEVFIDYGKGWEDDWDNHVRTFVPPDVGDYAPVKVLNDSIEKFLEPDELKENPYPSNAVLKCVYWPAENEAIDEESPLDNDEDPWHDGDGSIYYEENHDYQYWGSPWDCEVLERHESENGTSYTVEIFSQDGMTIWAANEKRRILKNYPQKSLYFVTAHYSSDQHIVGAFRSYIRIPDEIFPEKWKDITEDW